MFRQVFASSSDPNYQEISQRLIIAKDWDEYENMVRKVTPTGMFADLGPVPDSFYVSEEEYKDWYRSSETLAGDNPFAGNLVNKKWPLKKVLSRCINKYN